jgi:hypothetical protein
MIAVGMQGGTATVLTDRWCFNSDPVSVPGVSYKFIVDAGNTITVGVGIFKV